MRAYLEWAHSTGVSDHTVPSVIEWMTEGTSNLEQTSSALQEWIGGTVGANTPKQGAADLRVCAETFLLAVPAAKVWDISDRSTRVSTVKLAAKILADEAQNTATLRLLNAADFERLAQSYPGIDEVAARNGFRTSVTPLLRRELIGAGYTTDAATTAAWSMIGHPDLLVVLQPGTSAKVANDANTILIGSSTFSPQVLPQLLWDHFKAYERFDKHVTAVTALYTELGVQRPLQPLWISPDFSEVASAVDAKIHYESGVAPQLFDTDEIGDGTLDDPQMVWLQALHSMCSRERGAYWRRRNDDGKGGVYRGHRDIWQLVSSRVIDDTGLPHRNRASEHNAELLCDILGVAEVTRTDLRDAGLTQLLRLTADALPEGERVVRTPVKVTEVPDRTEVVLALMQYADVHGVHPRPVTMRDTIGFTATQVEAAFGITAQSLLNRLANEGYIPERSNSSMSELEQRGVQLLDETFDATRVLECSPRRWLSDEVMSRHSDDFWHLCRIDYVAENIDGFDDLVLCVEFDGEHHTRQIPSRGPLRQYRLADLRRHEQLRAIRASGVDAMLVCLHYGVLPKGSDPLIGAQELRDLVRDVRALGYTWMYVRPSGSNELRACQTTTKLLDCGPAGVEVLAAK